MQNDLVPFLKWAGGKRWISPLIKEFVPERVNRYIEPFLGSGATFFHLDTSKAILSDTNEDLIDTYLAIQLDWTKVFKLLKEHHRNHSKTHYYAVRDQSPRGLFTKAARFIYLNRTCWNGLYRVNLQGKFNVPIGTKSHVILNSDDFPSIANKLFDAELRISDFEEVIDESRKGDLVFADPPYTVKHNLNGFIKYNETLFSWDDQIRLSKALGRAASRGAAVILTNADHRAIRDLYKAPFHTRRAIRHSIISANSKFRKPCSEIVITANLDGANRQLTSVRLRT